MVSSDIVIISVSSLTGFGSYPGQTQGATGEVPVGEGEDQAVIVMVFLWGQVKVVANIHSVAAVVTTALTAVLHDLKK